MLRLDNNARHLADGDSPIPAVDLGADAIIDHFAELPEALIRLR